MRLADLAARLGAQLEGDPDFEVQSVASLASAGPADLAFLTDSRRASEAGATRAGALLCGANAVVRRPNLLRCADPALSSALAIQCLRPAWRPLPGIHPTASIHPDARLGARCHVGAFVAIGEGCRLGDDAVLHPHVVIYPDVVAGDRFLAHAHAVVREGTRIGHDVTLQSGVVVGGDGFGFARRPDGSHAKIPQVGTVSLGDRVEVQANSCIDRASLDVTRVGPGTIIDNLVQIAHNCEIEADVILCSQVGLAGHTRVERGAVLAGQVGVAGHCTVGAGAVITAQSGTHGDVLPGAMVSGSPAFDHAQWLRATAAFARLGDLQRDLRQLRSQIQKLSGNPAADRS